MSVHCPQIASNVTTSMAALIPLSPKRNAEDEQRDQQ